MIYFSRIPLRFFGLVRRLVDRLTGFDAVDPAIRRTVEIHQMDVRARLGTTMASVGSVVLFAMVSSYLGRDNPWPFYLFAFLVAAAYATMVGASRYWRRSTSKSAIFAAFQRGYCGIQLWLGLSWGGLIATALPRATPVQAGQVYAILIGLVSTAVFTGPALYSLSFWTPLVGLSVLALLDPKMQTNAATSAGILAYYLLTFFSILSINKKLLDREVNAIRIAKHKEDTDLLLRDFQEGASDWLWELDEQLHIIHPSERFCTAARRSAAELQGQKLHILAPAKGAKPRERDVQAFARFEERLAGRYSFRDLVLQVTVEDSLRWWELSARPVTDDGGRFCGYRGVGRDVTEIHQARARVEFLAAHDPLTELMNREAFNRAIAGLFAGAGVNATLLCIDLDLFKQVNDSFGHSTGDALLIAVCQRLRHTIREQDDAFRIGGDEFAVILGNTAITDTIAQRIIDALATPFFINGVKISIGASIGAAFVPGDGNTPEELHRNADLALYRAKAEGRNSYRRFDHAVDGQFGGIFQIAAELKAAVKTPAMFLEFQPILNLQSRRITGAEALLRWRHPSGAIVPPSVFIPLLEQSGQIIPAGFEVIRGGMSLAQRLPPTTRVSINLSPLQLADHSLPQKIEELIAGFAVEPGRIEFEVTESSLLDRDTPKLAVLDQIRELGCRIALDDFGTGYSSIRLLGQFPFDTLKIDASFIHGEASDPRISRILESMIHLGRQIGAVTIAEGVETASQAERLRSLNCDEGQGFLFHRPLSQEALLLLLEVEPAGSTRPAAWDETSRSKALRL